MTSQTLAAPGLSNGSPAKPPSCVRVTRFSGRDAPRYTGSGAPNCAPFVMELAYNSEVSAAGYHQAGRILGDLGLPTVVVQEGGYDLATIGSLVAETLAGVESSA